MRKFALILLTVIGVLTYFVLTLEFAYQKCLPTIAARWFSNMGKVSCRDLTSKILSGDPQAKLYSKEYATYEVPQAWIPGLNGIACSVGKRGQPPIAIISQELPAPAKQYVSYHEFVHLNSTGSETATNFRAAVRYPVGLVSTVFHSVTRNKPDMCGLATTWKLFKVYFLNDSMSDLALKNM